MSLLVPRICFTYISNDDWVVGDDNSNTCCTAYREVSGYMKIFSNCDL